jgi:hypothetical protein
MCKLKLTTLYTFIDDFFIAFFQTDIWKRLKHLWEGKRGMKKKLSLSEVITLNILRFYMRVDDLKTFHSIVVNHFNSYFPHIPNYENFLKATNSSLIFIKILLKYLMNQNTQKNCAKHFLDSTDITVCKNYNIFNHKVAKGIAARGKSSKGWFYGLKLHGIINDENELENVFFTPGNVHDNQVFDDVLKGIFGEIFCDSGYLLKKEELARFFKMNKRIFTAVRSNMKRLMTKDQLKGMRERSKIETVWDVIKERFHIVYHKARSITGMFRHYLFSLTAFVARKLVNGNQNIPVLMHF